MEKQQEQKSQAAAPERALSAETETTGPAGVQATCAVCVYNAAPRFPSSCRVGGLSDPEPAPPPKKLVGDTAVRVERPFATRLSEGTHTAARSPAPECSRGGAFSSSVANPLPGIVPQ